MTNTQIQKEKLRIALYQPQIPPNTGNIARTCAAFCLPLELIGPLGFSLNDKYLKRAGLDYWHLVNIHNYLNYHAFQATISTSNRLLGCSKYGGDDLREFKFQAGDILLFGREDTGLPIAVRSACDSIITIPMPGSVTHDFEEGVRSLNLSVSCALVAYQAWIQLN